MKSPVEESKIGIMLAQGFTKKEIANRTHKSIFTVNEQTRRLYERSGSRNLADITRWVIHRYTGIAVEDALINALHDMTVVAAAGLFMAIITSHGTIARLGNELSALLSSILN